MNTFSLERTADSKIHSSLRTIQKTLQSPTRRTGLLAAMLCIFPVAAFARSGSQLNAVSCGISSFSSPGTDACSVYLSGSTRGKLNVTLASNNGAVTVPSAVTVSAGASTTGFNATVSGVTTSQTATITAHSGTISKTFLIQLNPPATTPALIVNTTSVSFGSVVVNTPVTKWVTLTSAGTAAVTISSASVTGAGFSVSGASFPFTLNPGQAAALGVQFDPTATGSVTGQLTISSNSSTNPTAVIDLSGTGTTTTPALSALSCSSASFTGSGTDTCMVTLSGSAPSGGVTVNLASSNGAVTVPASVNVPASATSISFTANVSPVTSTQAASLAASANGVSKTFALQLNAATPTMSINATSVSFGSVVLNSAATQSVTLTSTGTASVTVSAVTVTGAGFSVAGATFPVTLNPGQALSLSVQFDPTVSGSVSGQLTFISNSSSSSTLLVSLSGTGITQPYEVNLSWAAPGPSTDPIVGYKVYRASTGSTSYQSLSSISDVQTTYIDSTVKSGQGYNYFVKSVDASGFESLPSNMVNAVIP